jgi:hypothetical protein
MKLTVSDTPSDGLVLANGLLEHIYMSPTAPEEERNLGAMLTWSPMHFSDFAFDLLALMNGTYRHGRVSSFHGFDFNKFA